MDSLKLIRQNHPHLLLKFKKICLNSLLADFLKTNAPMQLID